MLARSRPAGPAVGLAALVPALAGCIAEGGAFSSVEHYRAAQAAGSGAPAAVAEQGMYLDGTIRVASVGILVGGELAFSNTRIAGTDQMGVVQGGGGLRGYVGLSVPIRLPQEWLVLSPYGFVSAGDGDTLVGGGLELGGTAPDRFGIAIRVAGFEGFGAGLLVGAAFRFDDWEGSL